MAFTGEVSVPLSMDHNEPGCRFKRSCVCLACNLIIHPALKTFCVCVNKLFIDFNKSFMVLQKIMDFSIRRSITLKEPKTLMFCFCTWSCPDQTFSWVCINLKWKYQSDHLVFVCLSQSLPLSVWGHGDLPSLWWHLCLEDKAIQSEQPWESMKVCAS